MRLKIDGIPKSCLMNIRGALLTVATAQEEAVPHLQTGGITVSADLVEGTFSRVISA